MNPYSQKSIKNILPRLLVYLAFLGLPTSFVYSVDVPFVNGSAPVVPFTFTTNQTGMLAEINVNSGFSGNLTWSLFVPVALPLDGVNLAFPPGGVNNPARLEADPGGLSPTPLGEFQILVEDSGVPGSAMIIIVQFSIRDPFDVILVLDQSGSMGGDVDPSTPGNQPKIDELKQVAELFIQTARGEASLGLGDPGDPIITSGDQISAVYFSSASDDKDVSLVPFQANGADLLGPASIGGMTAGGATAMGQGIRDALQELQSSAGHTHNIIVITDGIQNVNPQVESTGGGSPTVTLDRDNDGSIEPGETLNDLDVRIFSIGLNTPTSHNERLDDMATATGAHAYFNFSPPNIGALASSSTYSLQHSFIDGLIDLIDNGSPQPVFYEYLEGNQTKNFKVNKAVRNLRLLIKSNINKISPSVAAFPIRFRLVKDGLVLNNVEGLVNVLPGSFYQMAFVNLSNNFILPDGTLFDPVGDWTLEVEARKGIRYEVGALLDDSRLDYELSFGNDDNLVDNDLAIAATLNYKGQPLWDGVTVRALILKPMEDLQTLLANTNTDPISQEQGGATAADKYQTLLNDPDFLAKTGLEDRLITLTNNNNGTFRGSFGDTDVTGTYRAIFMIDGSPTDIGPIERRINRFAIVRLHSIDYDDSEKELVTSQQNQAITGILFTPQGANNLLLGPGYAYDIDVQIVSGGGTIGDIRDNLNGSYFIPISGLSPTDDPEIRVTVKDEEFYEGLVSGFDRGGSSRWLLEFMAGLGTMDKLNGIGLQAELSRRFSRRTSGFDLLVGPYLSGIVGLEDPGYISFGGGALIGAEYRASTPFRLRIFAKLGGMNPNISGEAGTIIDEWGSTVNVGGTLAYKFNDIEVGARGEWGSIRSGMNANTDYQFYGLTVGFGF